MMSLQERAGRYRKIISEEDHRKPFSDQEIVECLKKMSGISIARRTVAKYREVMASCPLHDGRNIFRGEIRNRRR